MPKIKPDNLQRETLQKMKGKPLSEQKAKLIELRLEYSELSKLVTSYLSSLVGQSRIYPTHLPTQSSFRWSTLHPPLTNFPRRCINTACPSGEHEWTDICWSVRDIVLPDEHEVMISWDHDNIEGRIHDLYLNDQENLKAHREGYDLHTITCCRMFHIPLPLDLKDPHKSEQDAEWRRVNNWQGKDTTRRVLAKNFNHGSKYSTSPRFVYTIPNIEKYGVTRKELLSLANEYMALKREIFDRKRQVMNRIKRDKVARNLYGAKRQFYDSSNETAKEGFSFTISSTVSIYNNMTIIAIKKRWPDARFIHNAHDGDKMCFPRDSVPSIAELKSVIERPVQWEGRSVLLTAGIKIGV